MSRVQIPIKAIFYISALPWGCSAMTRSVHCRWEDETARERTCQPSLYADDKILTSYNGTTHELSKVFRQRGHIDDFLRLDLPRLGLQKFILPKIWWMKRGNLFLSYDITATIAIFSLGLLWGIHLIIHPIHLNDTHLNSYSVPFWPPGNRTWASLGHPLGKSPFDRNRNSKLLILERPQKRSRRNQLINRRLTKTKSKVDRQRSRSRESVSVAE